MVAFPMGGFLSWGLNVPADSPGVPSDSPRGHRIVQKNILCMHLRLGWL
jgi:hypothetical protein